MAARGAEAQGPLLPTQTYMTNVLSPIHYGELIGDVAQGFAQSVDPANTAPLDGGSLEFRIDGVLVCTLPYLTGRKQVCPATTGAGYSVGSYSLSALYTGNAVYASSASPLYPVEILPDDTQGTLAASANLLLAGMPVTLTAAFTAAFATPVGTVTFYDGTVPIGTATLNAQGMATLTSTTLAAGTHALSASLGASLNFNPSSTAPLLQTIVPAPLATTTALASSVNPSALGQSVTFTAAVAVAGAAAGVPGGSVTFTVDGAQAGVVALGTNGAASYSTGTLSAGSHTVLATFSGSGAGTGPIFAASTSNTLLQVVAGAAVAPGFTLTVNPAAVSVPVGNSAEVLVEVTALGGFQQAVSLACDSLPREVTCAFATDSVANGSGTSVLRVTAAAPHDCNSATPYFVAGGAGSWLGMLASSGLWLLLRRRRGLVKALALLLAVALLPALTGCGNCTDLGVFPGTYRFQVSAVGGNQRVTQTVQMVAHL